MRMAPGGVEPPSPQDIPGSPLRGSTVTHEDLKLKCTCVAWRMQAWYEYMNAF
jgi:hypothetical protein